MLNKLLNRAGLVGGSDEKTEVTVRQTALRIVKLGLSVFLGWTLLKGFLAVLPGLFIAAIGYLLLWKFTK